MKQSIFARVAQLAKANINALLDSAEDPQKMLDQMVRDYSAIIREAEAAVRRPSATSAWPRRTTGGP